jgi:hypothetical protein
VANTNTTSNIVDTLLVNGLLALREMAVMPRLVNRAYETSAGEQGSTIQIPIPSAITAGNVSPSNTPPDDTGVSPTQVSITLDQWKEAPFFISDKERREVLMGVAGFLPIQASEAVKALANTVDGAILDLYKDVYGYAGVAATTPFATDPGEYVDARKVLNKQLAPKKPRYVVLDEDAEANALMLRAFQDLAWRGDREGIIEGEIGRKLGSDWWMDQNVKTHTAGTASGATTDNAGYAVGVKTVTLDSAGTGSILVGDVITFAGDTQTYVVTTGDASVAGGGTVSFEPGLAVEIAGSETAITVKATHVANLAFHRDAFAFVNRPFSAGEPGVGFFRSAVDPVSGLALRLEVSRQHKRDRYAYDILYGVETIRPELAARLVG